MEKINLNQGGHATWDLGRERYEELTKATTLNVSDVGKTFFLNSDTEFETTLPAVDDAGMGWNATFIVKAAPSGADYTITEDTDEDTNVIVCNGINELEVDTSDDGPFSAGCTTLSFKDGVAVQGDWITIRCDGTNFYATGQTKADGGVAAS